VSPPLTPPRGRGSPCRRTGSGAGGARAANPKPISVWRTPPRQGCAAPGCSRPGLGSVRSNRRTSKTRRHTGACLCSTEPDFDGWLFPATTGRPGSQKIASPPTRLQGTADVGRRPFARSKSRKRSLDACRHQNPVDLPLITKSNGRCRPTGRPGSQKIATPPTRLQGTADVGRRPFARSKSRKRSLDACRHQNPIDRPLLTKSNGRCRPVPAVQASRGSRSE
jgi:hypothetical protein